MFTDRREAGIRLAQKLEKFRGEKCLVLGIPRGGVPVAAEVSVALGCPLDVVLVKKLGHPMNPEYAIGAVSLSDRYIVPHDDVTDEYIEAETERVRARLRQMQEKFVGNRKPESVAGKTVIVVDDGIATGRTLLATIQLLRKQHPAKLVIAVPVASDSAIGALTPEADEIVCLRIPPVFYGVGQFYENFPQVSDEEVAQSLNEAINPQ
jgi:predicted phosphoribosyltransferase